jgi:M6 family metalloprotease-like protein
MTTTSTTAAPTTTSSSTTTSTTTTTLPPTTTTTLPPGLVESAACKLPERAYTGVGIGFPRNGDRLQSVGAVQVAVLFADFPDVAATRTPEEVFGLIEETEEWFAAVSYGRLEIKLIPHLEWLPMANPAASYSDAIGTYDGHKAWIQEATDLADPDFDFTDVDEVVVMATPNAEVIGYGPTWTGGDFDDGAIFPDGQYITNGVTSGFDLLYWGFLWLPHEMGHSLSFVDLYSYAGGPGFTGHFTLMNDIAAEAPEYLAYERWHAGWLDDEQVLCVESDFSWTITPIEEVGGTKALMIPVGPSRAVVVESRRAIGYDSDLSREGAIVYVVDTSIYSGEGTIQLANDQQALGAGDSATVDGITITVLESTAEGDTVAVMVGG